MSAPKTPSGVNTQRLDSFMKGEAMTALSGGEARHVTTMLELARPRFAPNGMWTIGALSVRHIDAAGRQELKRAFSEFRREGGVRVIVITANEHVKHVFTNVIEELHLAHDIVETIADATQTANRYRTPGAKRS
ncbi:MAG TPA: hypothetical protein VMU11_01930 [Verrucomicrobiae bacterium]|nr:hypothetical protein [Verrucomicrobiae bacterium]